MRYLNYIEIYKFILVGIGAVCIDALIYFLLTYLDISGYVLSKRISFISGAFFAFFLNRSYVFQVRKKSFLQYISFIFLYFFSFLMNGYSHDVVFFKLNSPPIAFLIATVVSTTINFIGQKFVVFKNKT